MRLFRYALALSISLLGVASAHADPAPERALDLTTPQRAVEDYLEACREGDYTRAATALDLRGASQERQGALLARRLKLVLDAKLPIDTASLSDNVIGNPADGAATETLGIIRIDRRQYTIQLRRTYVGAEAHWLFAPRTVSAIQPLYDAYGPGLLGERMPAFLTRATFFQIELWQWIGLAALVALSLLVGFLISSLALRLGLRLYGVKRHDVDPKLIITLRAPTRFFISLVAAALLAIPLHLSPPPLALLTSVWRMLLVVSIAWYLVRIVDVVSDRLVNRAVSSSYDLQKARGVRTQVQVLRRVLHVVVGIVATALVLVQFEMVRNFGVSLLASAGVAGIVLGFAAQKSIGTLLAGIQLSITQPIRIGDTVVIENDSGTVEEITLTYVIVELWDQRRLIVPITHFLEKPFQNWTRSSSALLGVVDIQCEFTVPIDTVRSELTRFVTTHKDWDERKAALFVQSSNDRAITLRALLSAKDADALGSLRYGVREHLIAFLQKLDGGIHLPHSVVLRTGSNA